MDKIWLVPHPTHQFKEDVKKLARMHNLTIIDAKHAAEYPADAIAGDTPELTLKSAPAKAKK